MRAACCLAYNGIICGRLGENATRLSTSSPRGGTCERCVPTRLALYTHAHTTIAQPKCPSNSSFWSPSRVCAGCLSTQRDLAKAHTPPTSNLGAAGKVRLTKWFTSDWSNKEKVKCIREVSTMVLARGAKMSNILDFKDFKVVYRRCVPLVPGAERLSGYARQMVQMRISAHHHE
jgi:hypothetical protein